MVRNIKIVVVNSRFYKGLRGIIFKKITKNTSKIKKCAQNVHKKIKMFSFCSHKLKKYHKLVYNFL